MPGSHIFENKTMGNKYNPKRHHRRSIRLKGYDYSQAGRYFVTLCVKNRKCLFGNIIDGIMILNNAGCMVDSEWLKLPERFTNLQLHEYKVMPNHFHGILEILPVMAPLVGAPDSGHPQGIAPLGIVKNKKTLGDMVGAFESITTVEYIRGVKQGGWQAFNGKLWQRNYHERIIRNEAAYKRIAKYIIENPAKWDEDKSKPGHRR